MQLLTCASVLLLLLLPLCSNAQFNYGASDGPSTWATTHHRYCSGRKQSPIDLKVSDATYVSTLTAHTFEETQISSQQFKLYNDGKKVALYFNDSVRVRMGSGSTTCFAPHSMHWHWGSKAGQGSEHAMEGVHYVMEGHIVMWNCDFWSTYTQALDSFDGLAVLGVTYSESSTATLTSGFQSVVTALQSSSLQQCSACGSTSNSTLASTYLSAFSLKDLLPTNLNDYFMYDGSLTTPDCRENVLWTVYRNQVSVPSSVLTTFRNLKYYEGTAMADNFRPPQTLNPASPPGGNRQLLRSFSSTASVSHAPAASIVTVVTSAALIVIGCYF